MSIVSKWVCTIHQNHNLGGVIGKSNFWSTTVPIIWDLLFRFEMARGLFLAIFSFQTHLSKSNMKCVYVTIRVSAVLFVKIICENGLWKWFVKMIFNSGDGSFVARLTTNFSTLSDLLHIVRLGRVTNFL